MKIKLMGARLFAIVAMVLLLFTLGCSSPNSSSITITGLGWYYENIPGSFWSTDPGVTAFYDFFVHYTGNIAFGDIRSATVTAPDGVYWDVCPDSSFFDAQHRVIGGFGRFYDSGTPDVLQIGNYKVEVRLKDGTDAIYTGLIPAPGSTTTGPYTSMHTEEGPSAAGSAPMPHRAQINAKTLTGSSVSITFTVSDSLVNNGYVWFYDGSKNYLGGFFYFRDPATGATSPRLGSPANLTAGPYTLSLGSGDLTLATGVTSSQFFSQVTQFLVVLTDGQQYGLQADGYLRYDGRSISAPTPF